MGKADAGDWWNDKWDDETCDCGGHKDAHKVLGGLQTLFDSEMFALCKCGDNGDFLDRYVAPFFRFLCCRTAVTPPVDDGLEDCRLIWVPRMLVFLVTW